MCEHKSVKVFGSVRWCTRCGAVKNKTGKYAYPSLKGLEKGDYDKYLVVNSYHDDPIDGFFGDINDARRAAASDARDNDHGSGDTYTLFGCVELDSDTTEQVTKLPYWDEE